MAKVKEVWNAWRVAEALAEGAVAPVWSAPEPAPEPIDGLPGAGREWIREGRERP